MRVYYISWNITILMKMINLAFSKRNQKVGKLKQKKEVASALSLKKYKKYDVHTSMCENTGQVHRDVLYK